MKTIPESPTSGRSTNTQPKKAMVYYHPRPVTTDSNRGSDVRVAKMLAAFHQLDFEVIEIVGTARARHKKIKQLKSDITSGLKVEFVYGESTNSPIMLADKQWLPKNCAIDYAFFSWIHQQKIPFGMFYRDVYWRFDFFKEQLVWPLAILLKPIYYLDWYFYDKFCNVMFLPSESMNNYLPRSRLENGFQALPPGLDNSISPRTSCEATGDTLKLLYVGGIEPTVYDISPLMKIVARRDDVKLTICCRANEWQKYHDYYAPSMSENTQVAHANSNELEFYYHGADIFLMVTAYSEYRDFAMPVKFFEAIGYCLPIVSMNQKEVARYIVANDLGWVLQDFDELETLLNELSINSKPLDKKTKTLLSYRGKCLWEARAKAVSECLTRN